MAFSQKHTGKVLVPWFNTAEWQCVYNFLTSNLEEEKKRALEILKIWKLRTPLLSAGIAGTLILLETSLTNMDNLTEFQIVQIYSVTLLRFLNLCAANSDKQGTFNKTVSKNDIPKWLIDIRHDIAHSNKLPSKEMLELALNHSFEWVIEKYWKIQYDTISDYFVNNETNNTKIVDALNAYIGLSLTVHMDVDIKEYQEALMKKVNYLVSKRYNKPKTNKKGLLDVLEEILKQLLSNSPNNNIPNLVADVLVNVNGMLGTHLEINSEGIAVIPDQFKSVWTRLLNILHENDCLPALLEKFFLVACNNLNELTKQVAFTWLHNILDGLIKLCFVKKKTFQPDENESNENSLDLKACRIITNGTLELTNCIEFESWNRFPMKKLLCLENRIINGPVTIESTSLLEKVMLLSNRPKSMIATYTTLIKSLETPNKYFLMNSHSISTIEDIPMNEELLQALELNQHTTAGKPYFSNKNGSNEEIIPRSTRWEIEEDTSKFKDYPLGIIPNQSRTENPLIKFY